VYEFCSARVNLSKLSLMLSYVSDECLLMNVGLWHCGHIFIQCFTLLSWQFRTRRAI